MLSLIVHADDLGLSPGVNAGIHEAHRKGILTSASLMANGAAFDDAARMALETPSLDIGVHLTLIEETPLLDPVSIPSLVDVDGRFWKHANVLAGRYLRRAISMTEVRLEFEAQIRRVLDRGIVPSHLDSHQHVHMLPQLLQVTIDLARAYRIPAVRFPAERLSTYMLTGSAPVRVAQMLALSILSRLQTSPTHLVDHFVGFYYGGRLNATNLRQVIASLPASGSCELMCHPGFDDAESPYRHWNYRWSDEMLALTDQRIAALLEELGVRLISYRDLMQTAAYAGH